MRNIKKSLAMMKKYKSYLFLATPFRKPILKKGKGVWVEDVDANKYLDLMSGQFSLPLGHSQDEFVKLIVSQVKKIIHTNTLFLTEEVFLGMEVLCSITAKDLKKVIFLSTGAEAVEFALRHAKLFTGKDGVVSLTRGYHGLTLAAQSLSNEGKYAVPIVPKSYHIPTPDCLNRPCDISREDFINNCLNQSRELLVKVKGGIAAFIVEPVISVGGMIFPPKQYFKGLQEMVREHEALLIFDECQTGIGRTGKWFGYEHFDIVPDMLILAKGMGLGLPTSAVVMKSQIASALEGKIMHFSSHQNDPFSGATTEFLIRYMKKNKLLGRINKTGAYLLSELQRLSQQSSLLKNPRGLGLMIGFDLPAELFNNDFNPGAELAALLESEGVLVQATRKGQTFRVMPSYLITRKEIDFFIKALHKCLNVLDRKIKNSK